MVLVSTVWMVVSLVVGSEPGIGLLVGVLWLSFSGALVLSWLGFLPFLTWRTWRKGRPSPRFAIAYVVLPVFAVALLLTLLATGLPVRTRFELSEGALTELAERCTGVALSESCDRSHRVGLYNIDAVLDRNRCVVLATEVFIEYVGGFAYCPGAPPEGDYVRADHLKGPWWTYVYDSNRGPVD
jgi:hypothetical protein